MTGNMERLAEMEGEPPTFEELERADKLIAQFANFEWMCGKFGVKRMPEDIPEDEDADMPSM